MRCRRVVRIRENDSIKVSIDIIDTDDLFDFGCTNHGIYLYTEGNVNLVH